MKAPASPTAHATAVWLLLVLATCASWWMVEHDAVPARVATSAAVIIAMLKARLVFLHFMELRSAPRAWRAVFEFWAALSAGLILTGYWIGPS